MDNNLFSGILQYLGLQKPDMISPLGKEGQKKLDAIFDQASSEYIQAAGRSPYMGYPKTEAGRKARQKRVYGQTKPSPTPTPTDTKVKGAQAKKEEPFQLSPEALKDYTGPKNIIPALPTVFQVASDYGIPPETLLAQYWQESSFGTNPNIWEENSATALGPLQIKRNWTGEPPYPAFQDLVMQPGTRTKTTPSLNFAGKHYRYLTDYYGSPNTALASYGTGPEYAQRINELAQSDLIQSLMPYFAGGDF